jgi:uncharacterized BrkB/YihY/UPF0761 family membrane protein
MSFGTWKSITPWPLLRRCPAAYDVSETRRYWKTRSIAIGLTFSVGFLLVVALGLLLVGPSLSAWLTKTLGMGTPLSGLVFEIAVGGWIGLSYLLRIYFQDFFHTTKAMATLGVALAFSIWLYWTGFVILIGAQFNSALIQEVRGASGEMPTERDRAA